MYFKSVLWCGVGCLFFAILVNPDVPNKSKQTFSTPFIPFCFSLGGNTPKLGHFQLIRKNENVRK